VKVFQSMHCAQLQVAPVNDRDGQTVAMLDVICLLVENIVIAKDDGKAKCRGEGPLWNAAEK
jgi:hypothetical protein